MKIILSVLFILMMTACYDGTRVEKNARIGYTNAYYFTEAGMRFVVLTSNDSRGGIVVINITKDSLEVARMIRPWWNVVPEDSATTNNH